MPLMRVCQKALNYQFKKLIINLLYSKNLVRDLKKYAPQCYELVAFIINHYYYENTRKYFFKIL